MTGDVLHHFSEDPHIVRFEPHVPATNPTHRAGVWVIDAAHAPLYWFPRDCPRVTVWPRTSQEVRRFESTWNTSARRVHVIELGWLDRMRTTRLFRYDFDASAFAPWADATGQWFTEHAVEPVGVAPMGDLLDLHVAADVELRATPSLWPAHDLAISDAWDFSIVRMRNALPDQRRRPALGDSSIRRG